MPTERKETIREMLLDRPRIEAALRRAAREAAILHKRAGVPLVIWKDGKVVNVPPEEIEIPDLPELAPRERR